jgi:protein SDA1
MFGLPCTSCSAQLSLRPPSPTQHELHLAPTPPEPCSFHCWLNLHCFTTLNPADLKAANQKGRNERLNKSVQSFLYSVLADDNELAAKKSLAVLSELWRRHIWRDGRTVNCIGRCLCVLTVLQVTT